MSISCSVEGCNEDVIGQCPGYKEPCGRYYCRKHSSGKLCDECAAIQERERIYDLYSKTALDVNKGTGLSVFTWVFLLPPAIVYPIALSINLNSAIELGEKIKLWFVSIICGFISIAILRHVKNRRSTRYAEACQKLEGFDNFFIDWKKKKTKEAWETAGLVTVGFIVGTAVAAASGNSSMENDVRRIRDRLDRM